MLALSCRKASSRGQLVSKIPNVYDSPFAIRLGRSEEETRTKGVFLSLTLVHVQELLLSIDYTSITNQLQVVTLLAIYIAHIAVRLLRA